MIAASMRDGDGGPFVAAPFRDLEAPGLEPRRRLAFGQEHMRRLALRGPRFAIADVQDVSLEIDAVARPDAPRRQPEMRADCLRSANPVGLVDAGLERQGGDRPDARKRHEAAHPLGEFRVAEATAEPDPERLYGLSHLILDVEHLAFQRAPMRQQEPQPQTLL